MSLQGIPFLDHSGGDYLGKRNSMFLLFLKKLISRGISSDSWYGAPIRGQNGTAKILKEKKTIVHLRDTRTRFFGVFFGVIR
jgi:hypothetical protein